MLPGHSVGFGNSHLKRHQHVRKRNLTKRTQQKWFDHGTHKESHLVVGHRDGLTKFIAIVGYHEVCDIAPGRFFAENGRKQSDKERVRCGIKSTNDAPVDNANASVAQQHHVSRVNVTVEGAPTNGHREETANQLINHGSGVKTKGLNLRKIINGHAIEILHRQNISTREFGVGNWHDNLVETSVDC